MAGMQPLPRHGHPAEMRHRISAYLSHIVCRYPDGRQVVADTTDPELAAALTRATLDMEGAK